MSQQRFHDPMPRFPPRGPLGRLFPRFRGTTKALRLPAVPPAALRCLRLAVPRERTALFVPPDAAARQTSGLGLVTRYPRPGLLPWKRQDLSSFWGTPISVCTCSWTPDGLYAPDHYGALTWPPSTKTGSAVVQQNFEAGYSMAFGSPPTYHKYRLPSTGKAGFQVLVRLSCTGFPPAGVLQKVSNSRHVCFPPFPGFSDTIWGLCVNPLNGESGHCPQSGHVAVCHWP